MNIILAAQTTGAIALGTNAINYSQRFRDVTVRGVYMTPREVPFSDILSMFRDVHHRTQILLKQNPEADIAVLFTNELVSFRNSLATRVTFSIGMIFTCFKQGGGVNLTVQSNWMPKNFRKKINKLGDMFEGEVQQYFERHPGKRAVQSAAAIWDNLRGFMDIPVTEYYESVH